ncbi:MAG: hypothetical protein ACREKB_00885 [Candidatus Rokuibacteriota bacterium]
MQHAAPRTVFLAVAAILACGDPALSPAGGDASGAYTYEARSGLFPVVIGTVTLTVEGDSAVTGTWELRRFPGSDPHIEVGPQIGSGTLAGRLTASGIVAVDLNPGWADNNVFLALGGITRDRLTGTWDHSTIIGPVAGGAVELRRLIR